LPEGKTKSLNGGGRGETLQYQGWGEDLLSWERKWGKEIWVGRPQSMKKGGRMYFKKKWHIPVFGGGAYPQRRVEGGVGGKQGIL